MKYWQEDRWQLATRNNVPHLYLYTWIRVSVWFFCIFNSIVMIFMTKEDSVFDNLILRDDIFCIEMAVLGFIAITIPFSIRKVDRTIGHVIFDVIEVGALSLLYVLGNAWMIAFYIVEILFVIYWGVKIEKDNSVIDDNKVVIWWKNKKQEKFDRKVRKFIENNRNNRIKVEKAEEEKMKRMSRKQRKQYKNK